MGIFKFLRGFKKSEFEKISKENNDSIKPKEKSIHDTRVNRDPAVRNKNIELSDNEIQNFIRQEIEHGMSNENTLEYYPNKFDPLFREAAEIIVIAQNGSASLLHKKLKVDFVRAGKMIDELELTGIISPYTGSSHRTVNITDIGELHHHIENINFQDERKEFFNTHILPLHENYIAEKIEEIRKQKRIDEEINYKDIIRNEIIEKEKYRVEKEKRKKISFEIRNELIQEGILADSDDIIKREKIPQEVLDKVWNRDSGKCVNCGSREKIEFDHIIPFSRGGSNTYRNIQILCEKCNREKSNDIG